MKLEKMRKNEKAEVDIIHGNKHDTKQKKEEQKEPVSMMKEVKEVKSTGWVPLSGWCTCKVRQAVFIPVATFG